MSLKLFMQTFEAEVIKEIKSNPNHRMSLDYVPAYIEGVEKLLLKNGPIAMDRGLEPWLATCKALGVRNIASEIAEFLKQ